MAARENRMPLYDYACDECGARTEDRRPIRLGPRRGKFRCRACGKRAMRSAVVAPRVLTDSNFAMHGRVYPGINGNRPIESRRAFLNEVAAKGLDHCSVGEIIRGPPKSLDRVREEQFAADLEGD